MMLPGDVLDGIKELRSKGLTMTYIASQLDIVPQALKRYIKWGRLPIWLCERFEAVQERLDKEAADGEIADLRDFITRLAHYMAACEVIKKRWRFPFHGFPEPEQRHIEAAELIARTGNVQQLALALLERDFFIKRFASYKMFCSENRVRDHQVPNWPGLWGWLDIWNHLISRSLRGRIFLKRYALRIWQWKTRDWKKEITDDRSEIFDRIDRLTTDDGPDTDTEREPPEWYVQRKGNSISKALGSGRGKNAGYRLEYSKKAKTR